MLTAENPGIRAANRSLSLSYLNSALSYIEPDDGQYLNTGYFGAEGIADYDGFLELFSETDISEWTTGLRLSF